MIRVPNTMHWLAAFTWPTAGVALVLGGIAWAVLLVGRRHLSGTTLGAAWYWALLSATGLMLVQLAIEFSDQPPWAAAGRFAAAVTGFCPAMAVLGAKRPQHQAWTFIVLSMWVVLSLPAAELLVLQRAAALQIQGLRWGFLILLTAICALNHLPTRFWLAALLYAGGQTLVLLDAWSWSHWIAPETCYLTGFGVAVSALAVGVWQLRRRPPADQPWDRVWLDYRDQFGVLWSLRMMERVNAAASSYDWPVRLTWWGFHQSDGRRLEPSLEAIGPELDTTMRNLFRRFVSVDWIASRLDATLD